MRLCPSICVPSKNTHVCVLPLENLHENTLCRFFTEFIVLWRRFLCWQALLERLIHGFLKLRVLVRALLGVSPNLLYPYRRPHSVSIYLELSMDDGYVFIRTLVFLPVRSMRQGYAFVSVYMCVCVCLCVCVSSKNTPVCVLQLENLHENSLCSFFTEFIVLWRRFLCWQALFERLIHGYLKLRVLVLEHFTVLWVCHPTSYPCRCPHSVSHVPYVRAILK